MTETEKLIEEEKKLEKLLQNRGQHLPAGISCPHCDFSGGTRGMDRCHICDGTGSVFRGCGRYYPNTQRGYIETLRALVDQ